jgi:hypothetical protein
VQCLEENTMIPPPLSKEGKRKEKIVNTNTKMHKEDGRIELKMLR